jgi:hypothetical protein
MTAGRRRALAGFLACLAVFGIAASPLRAADEDRPLELGSIGPFRRTCLRVPRSRSD